MIDDQTAVSHLQHNDPFLKGYQQTEIKVKVFTTLSFMREILACLRSGEAAAYLFHQDALKRLVEDGLVETVLEDGELLAQLTLKGRQLPIEP